MQQEQLTVQYSYLQETIGLQKTIAVSFVTLGERLMKIRNENLWQAGYDSFLDFLEDARMSESTASKLITIYEKLVIKFGYSPEALSQAKDWSNIYLVTTLADTKEAADEWLEKSKELRSKDFRIAATEKKKGIDCVTHDFYTIRVCHNCGLKEKIYEDEKM